MKCTDIGLILFCIYTFVSPVRGQGLVNIAAGKRYSQSSYYNSGRPSSNAANGDTGGTYDQNNCIHTRYSQNPWWEVDLGRKYPIYDITVWGRSGFLSRLYPFTITVDGQVCASVSYDYNPPRSKSVMCSTTIYGQQVRIIRTGNVLLNLCEVQIWDCVGGYYGTKCDSKCPSNCQDNHCDICAADYYGPSCSSRCLSSNCQDSYCDRNSGLCIGCKAGYYGTNCYSQCFSNCHCDRSSGSCRDCIAGYYGTNCNSHCHSSNCQDNRCDRNSGLCTACNGNFEGDTCSDCIADYYGNNCDSLCHSSSCRNNRCDRDSGLCTACNGNFEGDTCSVCKAGYYGSGCNSYCRSTECQDSRCDRDSGWCTSCNGNFEGDTCSDCKAGYYGTGCNSYCRSSNCQDSRCDRSSGWCASCNGNFEGDTCSECRRGYHGDDCNQQCSTLNNRCTECTKDGQCLACRNNFAPPGCTECLNGYYKQPSWVKCYQCTSSCKQGTVCDKTTGYCDICPPGRQGNMCDQNCAYRKYGQNCTGECGHCLNNAACDVKSGQCQSCEPGWKPTMCDEECDDGQYGPGCSETCGHCMDGSICNKNNGHCPLCEPGWYPPLCNSPCQKGTYGMNCSQTCGSCLNDEPCDKYTGHCPCPPGKQPPLCDSDCRNKRYGADCQQTCGQCKNGQACHPVTGECIEGCQPGWMDQSESATVRLCKSKCSEGFFGEGCNKTCGRCQGTTICLHDTGECVAGCAAGFTGVQCLQAVKEDDPPVATIAGAIVAVVIAILITAVVIFIIFRRRQRSSKKTEISVDGGAMQSGSPEGASESNNDAADYSAPLSFSPLIADSAGTEPKTIAKSDIKPAVRPKPTIPAKKDDAIYQNITLEGSSLKPAFASTNPIPNKTKKGNAQKKTAAADDKKKTPIVVAVKGKSPEVTIVTNPTQGMTDDEELDFFTSAEDTYANEQTYSNLPPTNICLALLQEIVVKKLHDSTLEGEFGRMIGVKNYPITNGEREANYYKNRFNSILPYDKTRVELEPVDGDDSSDYINASFIKGYKREKAYIASQGPKANTQDDFWRMVWQEGVIHVVMLTNLKEGNKVKCHGYWPAKGESVNTGHMVVTGVEEEHRAFFIIRTFELKQLQGKDKRQITQFHYINWMDHEVPAITPLISFWRYVRGHAPRTPSVPPLVVHCSAGVGRTGTYIALDIIFDQAKEEAEINIFNTVDSLREDRCHMVQNKSQYKFLHEAVLEVCMSRDTRILSSNMCQVFPQPIHHQHPNQRIDAEFETLSKLRTCLTTHSYTTAKLKENHGKNRNPAILPDDKHMVFLQQHVKGRNQYINAVYVPTLLSPRGCIITQLPLPDTVVDMWRLVDGCNVSTIVSIGDIEGQKDTCCYWPLKVSQHVKTDVHTVTLESVAKLGDTLSSYTVKVVTEDKNHEVRVLHYKAWTDEVADNIQELILLLDILHSTHKDTPDRPIVIQCFDGATKSGALCAMWNIFSQIMCDGELDVFQAVRQVHIARPESVSSVEQYRFCYEVAQEYSNSYNVYANT